MAAPPPSARRLVRLSRLAAGSLVAVMLADLLAICAEFFYVEHLRSVAPSTIVAESELVLPEVFILLAALLQIAALASAGVTFLKWLRQAYVNVPAITGRETDQHDAWAIWAFFVPILCLFRPQMIVREIWDSAERMWLLGDERAQGRMPPKDCVNLWWGLFLGSVIVDNVINLGTSGAATASDTRSAITLYLMADVLDVPSAIVAIVLVHRVTELQVPLLAEPAASVPWAPAGGSVVRTGN
ncbi:MAG: DUF4328 domain-containing protein [Vicinamibacterales bacterium]